MPLPLTEDLPLVIAARYSIYTLACYELLQRLSRLRAALVPESDCAFENCIAEFDSCLSSSLQKSTSTDVQEYAHRLAERLGILVKDLLPPCPEAGGIFEEVRASVLAYAAEWNYLDNLDIFHSHGYALAGRMYTNDLCHAAGCVCCRMPALDKRPLRIMTTAAPKQFNHPKFLVPGKGQNPEEDERLGAPMSYDRDKSEIILRFRGDDTFGDYLAYLFLFLHEYTAHVYAHDNDRNFSFQDGWMITAASTFLERHWIDLPAGDRAEALCDPVQVYLDDAILSKSLQGRMQPRAREACNFTRRLVQWLGSNGLESWFYQVSHELARYESDPSWAAEPRWPQQFMHRLWTEFESPGGLERWLRLLTERPTARELFSRLSLHKNYFPIPTGS